MSTRSKRSGSKSDQADAPGVASATTGTGSTDAKAVAQDMLDFINYSWTPFHAVEEASRRLMAAGFQHISEKVGAGMQSC